MEVIKGELDHGIKVGEAVYKKFQLEEVKTAKDLREIDLLAQGQGSMAHDMHRAARQITFLDSQGKAVEVVVTIDMLDQLHPRDWVLIRSKQGKLDQILFKDPEQGK